MNTSDYTMGRVFGCPNPDGYGNAHLSVLTTVQEHNLGRNSGYLLHTDVDCWIGVIDLGPAADWNDLKKDHEGNVRAAESSISSSTGMLLKADQYMPIITTTNRHVLSYLGVSSTGNLYIMKMDARDGH